MVAAADEFPGLDWHSAQSLQAFVAAAPVQSQADQEAIVDAAMAMLSGYYAHLPQKRLDHGIEPAQMLRGLRRRLGFLAGPTSFHAELARIFAELRDLHTGYVLPAPYPGHVAFLPFQMADSTKGPMVSQVLPGFDHPDFVPGVTLRAWNGVPIARAVELLAASCGGANPAAARARATAAMTQRPMQRLPPPDAAWIEVEYADLAGATKALRLEWRVCALRPDPWKHDAHDAPATSLDSQGDALRRHRREAYVPHARADTHPFQAEIPTHLDFLRAWVGEVDGQDFGVLRIRAFSTPDAEGFLAEIRRLLALLPRDGLIIDLRDNPGGLVEAAERMLQYLAPGPITPIGMEFVASDAALALCRAQTPANPDMRVDLSPWIPSLQAALAAKAMWSDALPMTPPEACNDTGRIYPGSCLLITNALCYSAADIFIAGFRDHAIGPILGIDANTGAGGANVWTHGQITGLIGTPLTLPGGAQLRVAIRRAQRVAAGAGQPLEEAGIVPDQIHVPTPADLLGGDGDMIRAAARMLQPAR